MNAELQLCRACALQHINNRVAARHHKTPSWATVAAGAIVTPRAQVAAAAVLLCGCTWLLLLLQGTGQWHTCNAQQLATRNQVRSSSSRCISRQLLVCCCCCCPQLHHQAVPLACQWGL